jgi:DHA1 family purine ribonucleoside efflux pump-like MFS transporter
MGFTYIRPAGESTGLDAGGIAMLLLVYGVAVFIGNIVAGPLADRRLRFTVIFFPIVLGGSMLAFAATGGTLVAAFAFVVSWGLAFGAVPTLVQTWFATVEPDRLESIGGLVVTSFQIAIALGAALGGLLVDTVGVDRSLVVGGIAAIVGGILLGAMRLRR